MFLLHVVLFNSSCTKLVQTESCAFQKLTSHLVSARSLAALQRAPYLRLCDLAINGHFGGIQKDFRALDLSVIPPPGPARDDSEQKAGYINRR